MADKDRTSYSGIFLLLAIVGVLSAIVLPHLIEKYCRPLPERTKIDLRDIAVALETYYLDNSCYPLAVNAMGRPVIKPITDDYYTTGYIPGMLTTPIAFLTDIPVDRYAPMNSIGWSRGYRYAAKRWSYWILASRGPDNDDDMVVEDYILSASGDITHYVSHFGPGKAVEYDPTNGTRSSGDIFRTGP